MPKESKGVRLDHISKIYTDPKTGKDFYAVHDVSLDIAPGSFVTLLGPSGCGKTTTLRMVAGCLFQTDPFSIFKRMSLRNHYCDI